MPFSGGRFGVLELLIIFAVALLLFGIGRISKIGGELGKGIHAFKKGLKGEDEQKDQEEEKKNDNIEPS